MTRVNRFDVACLGKPERTSQGFLRVKGFLTRAGVLEYKRADGTVVRELRPPDEVFGARSLATLSAAPLTDLHPTTMVSPSNVRDLAIGIVSDNVVPRGDLVEATVTVQHADAIAAVEKGDRRELSCGYQCRIDATPGTYKGQAYDQVQRDIVYNHVALGPRGWGRAGRDVALRVDGNDAGAGVGEGDHNIFRLDAADALAVVTLERPPEATNDGDQRDDGGDPDAGQPAEIDAALGRCDALELELGEVRAALAEAQSPRAFNSAVHARAVLLLAAQRVLGEDLRCDGLADRDVHLAVLRQLDSGTDYSAEDDAYVRGRFDAAIAGRDGRNHALDHARRLTTAQRPALASRIDAKPYVPLWRQPLSVSKKRLQHGEDV